MIRVEILMEVDTDDLDEADAIAEACAKQVIGMDESIASVSVEAVARKREAA